MINSALNPSRKIVWSHYWASVEGRAKVHRRPAKRNRVAISSHKRTFGAEVAVLGIVIAILQIADGLLTGMGVSQFGLHMEGNGLLRFLMHYIGYVPALVLVKSSAVAVIAGLCIYGSRVRWMTKALRGLIGFYLLLAIIPWTLILGINLINSIF